MPDDAEWRTRVFSWLDLRLAETGGALSRDELLGDRPPMKLLDRSRGIRNPAELASTLSIMSSPDGPYDDHDVEDGLFRYAVREGDPLGGDNRKLHSALRRRDPMVLLRRLEPGTYVPYYPVYAVGVDLVRRHFLIALDPSLRYADDAVLATIDKGYAARLTRQRLHQPVFRSQVLTAYDRRCAMCRLAHVPLLDAAHITADSEADGDAVVTNGLALCKIHHAAYDRDIIGVSPDRVVVVDADVLRGVDGPMLRHGIQALHGQGLHLPDDPRQHPDRDRLERRFAAFRSR